MLRSSDVAGCSGAYVLPTLIVPGMTGTAAAALATTVLVSLLSPLAEADDGTGDSDLASDEDDDDDNSV